MAQMVPNTQIVGQAPELGIDPDHVSKDFTVTEIDVPGRVNVLAPGENPPFTFQFSNISAAQLTAKGHLEILHYGTRGVVGDIWKPEFFVIGKAGEIPIEVDLAPKASTAISIPLSLPETYGGYVIVADLGPHGRCFAGSVVRVMSPDGGRVKYPAFALDFKGHTVPTPETFLLFKKLGVKGARMEMSPFPPGDEKSADRWNALDENMKSILDNEITVMFTVGNGTFEQALGMQRPFLDDSGLMFDGKPDQAWLPKDDEAFTEWTHMASEKYGWPNGPLNSMELWNEPWEGSSIAGWGADMLRYREIYMAMVKGIEKARAEQKVTVLAGAAGSSTNTLDKFFSDGSDTFLKWLDFTSIHYQPMNVVSSLVPEWRNRKDGEGAVKVWDTESWIANTDDRAGLVVASMHAMGEDRAMGIYAGNVYEPVFTRVDGQGRTIVQAWSAAASLAASQKFIGQRPFRKLLFKTGLPWIFVFDGAPVEGKMPNPDDGTVVVSGDLSSVFERDCLLFRSVYGLKNLDRIAEIRKKLAGLQGTERQKMKEELKAAEILQGGSMTIDNSKGEFAMKDFYGNEVSFPDGKIVVPLNAVGYYLRTNGKPGSFQRLLTALQAARIDGYEPLDIKIHDLTSRVGEQPSIKLTLTNILNRPVSGTLHLAVDHLKMKLPDEKISFQPHETKEILVATDAGDESPDNTYAAHLTFDAGADGRAVAEENLHVNVIANRHITVDGQLDDWKGVLPQPIIGDGIGANLTEKAWLPFQKFDDALKSGVSTGYLACDDQNFYFAARIADDTPDEGMIRTETRDDDAYFYPATSYYMDPAKTLAQKDADLKNAAPGAKFLQNPDEGKEPLRAAWESTLKSFAVDFDLAGDTAHQVAFHVLDPDLHPIRAEKIEVIDAKTDRILDSRTVNRFGDGKDIVYELAGNVRVKFTSLNQVPAILSGFFFDPSSAGMAANGPSAKFIKIDTAPGAKWKGVYGSEGYRLAGTAPHLPEYAKITIPDIVDHTALAWPDGVRRYSYRKMPDLPSGTGHDNVQIAFNVLPPEQKSLLLCPDGTMPGFEVYPDTDYEYALNPVAAKYGGGTEVWRLAWPGMPLKHFYPREPKSKWDGAVKDAKLVVRREGNTRIVEASIPWSEIPEVKKRYDQGQPIKFSFRVNDNGGPSYELAAGRSVSKTNSLAFHDNWQTHWANELEFQFEKK